MPLCRNVGLLGRAHVGWAAVGWKSGLLGGGGGGIGGGACDADDGTEPRQTRAEITFDIGQYRATRARCRFLRHRRRSRLYMIIII